MADKKDDKVNKGIFDMHVIDVYLTRARSSTWVFDTGSVANICNSKQGLRIKRRLSKDEVTMRVRNSSKVDVIVVCTLLIRIQRIYNFFIIPCYYIICFGCLMGFNMLFILFLGLTY